MASLDSQYVTIPWDDGTDENFYFNFAEAISGGNIKISSDENSQGVTRTKILVFQGTSDPEGLVIDPSQAVAYLKVVQQADGLIVATFENTTSIYEEVGAGYYKV